MPDPVIPAAKVEAATDAMYRHSRWSCFWSREDAAELALAALRAAAAYDAEHGVLHPVTLHYIHAVPTDEQREAARNSWLSAHGDMRLLWVNEGDLAHTRNPARGLAGRED